MRVETHLPLGKVDPGLRATDAPLHLPTAGAQAALVERLGFDGLVLTESKEDPFVVMAVGAERTERIRLTTAVAIAFPRSPTVTAMTAWTLARLSGGRFTLGLGTQVKGHIERRYGLTWSAPARGSASTSTPSARSGAPGSTVSRSTSPASTTGSR